MKYKKQSKKKVFDDLQTEVSFLQEKVVEQDLKQAQLMMLSGGE